MTFPLTRSVDAVVLLPKNKYPFDWVVRLFNTKELVVVLFINLAMRVLDRSVRLLMSRFQMGMLLKKPKPLVLAVAPLAVPEMPLPRCRVPPVIVLLPPVVADHATPAVAACGSTMVTSPPLQLTVVLAPIEKVVAVPLFVACGST